MGNATTRTSRPAIVAFFAGLLAILCGVMTLASQSDLFLLGVVVLSVLAIVLGIFSLYRINWSAGRLAGKALAGCGMGMPVCAFGLGFLLLPAT